MSLYGLRQMKKGRFGPTNVEMGWFEGIDQADQIYTENLARLKRDYQGMIRYRMLLAQNMVSAPQVAHRELGVTGGGEELSD